MRAKQAAALVLALAAGVGGAQAGLGSRPRPKGALAANRKHPAPARSRAKGPLRVHPTNPRYFTDSSGRAVYLTGSHTWNTLQDAVTPSSPPFDYVAFLDRIQSHHHNFFRLWTRMGTGGGPPTPSPTIYRRTGPGKATDGGPKYDLARYNEAFFRRLRARVRAAGDRGIYVAVMFFGGDNVVDTGGNPNWPLHPYHRDNNINGVNGDPNGDGQGLECYRLDVPAITVLQDRYVKKVIDTLSDLDNVLWEVGNELPGTLEFAYRVTRLVKEYESSQKRKRHPVGISTFADARPPMRAFMDGPADWITPDNSSGDYTGNPPAADGKKVMISDTDHLWGVGGDRDWVWKSFTRGLNPIYMDPLDAEATRERARRAMGHTRIYAEKMNLAVMVPHAELASTTYCLADPGKEYLVYLPEGGQLTVDLSAARGDLAMEWFNPETGKTVAGSQKVPGGARRELKAPFEGDAVLYLARADVKQSTGVGSPMRVLENVVIYEDPRFYSAFPSIVRRADSELLVAFRRAPERRRFGEPAVSHTDPNSNLVLVRSKDGGKTWSGEPELIHAHPFGGSQDPCMIQLRDGTILCSSYAWALLEGEAIPRLKQPVARAGNFVFLGGYLMRSRDGGRSWQGPLVPPPCRDEAHHDIFGNLVPAMNRGAMCEGRDGKLYWVVASSSKYSPQRTATHLLISEDKGETWNYSGVVAQDPKGDFNEASLYQTPKGDLVAFLRTEQLEDHTYIARSSDGGKSFRWHDAGFQGHPHHALRLPDNRVLLVYGFRHPPFGIRARVMNPECTDAATAPEIVLRDDGGNGDLGYPWASMVSDERALIVYYFNRSDGTRHIAGTLLQVK
jgi:sialidase-1